MEEIIKILLLMIISNYFLLLFILIIKKVKKKSNKYGHYTLSPKILKMYYIFSKKRKTENTFIFKVYGKILIELKYYETDKVDLQIKPRQLDIKFKQKFREYLNKNQKIDVIEYNNIKLYKNK